MNLNKPTRIFIHTVDADYNIIVSQFFSVDEWHKDRFGEYCKSSLGYYGGYTTLIEKNGDEFRYREDNEETCAATGYNTNALHVALAGDGDIQLPTEKQAAKLKLRLEKWTEKYSIPVSAVNIAPHRMVAPHKSCFGSLLNDEWAYNLLKPKEKPSSQLDKKEFIESQKTQILWLTVKLLRLKIKILLGKIGGSVFNPRPLKDK